jgi:hypothetical protein
MLPGLPGLPGARDGGVSGLRGVRGLPGSPEFPGVPEALGGAELFRSTARRDLRALCDGVRGLELPGALEPGAIAPGPAVCAPVAAESRMPSGSATQGVIRIDMEIVLARKCGVEPDSHLTRMHALRGRLQPLNGFRIRRIWRIDVVSSAKPQMLENAYRGYTDPLAQPMRTPLRTCRL